VIRGLLYVSEFFIRLTRHGRGLQTAGNSVLTQGWSAKRLFGGWLTAAWETA